MNIPRARQALTHVDVGYPMVAEVQGHRVLFYRQFGSYQGEWLLFSYMDEHFFIWKDWYGSCSGCDAIEGKFSWSDRPLAIDDPKVVEFCKTYKPFLKMTASAAARIAEEKGTLGHLIPANLRTELDSDEANIGRQFALIVKGEVGTITAPEILEIDNQETRRIAIERFNPELFVRDTGAEAIHREGESFLYRITRPGEEEDFVFLYVKDPSTERRYVLRVPPDMRRVNQARAFTFGLPEDSFVLSEET